MSLGDRRGDDVCVDEGGESVAGFEWVKRRGVQYETTQIPTPRSIAVKARSLSDLPIFLET